jgi:hypothetical protein
MPLSGILFSFGDDGFPITALGKEIPWFCGANRITKRVRGYCVLFIGFMTFGHSGFSRKSRADGLREHSGAGTYRKTIRLFMSIFWRLVARSAVDWKFTSGSSTACADESIFSDYLDNALLKP